MAGTPTFPLPQTGFEGYGAVSDADMDRTLEGLLGPVSNPLVPQMPLPPPPVAPQVQAAHFMSGAPALDAASEAASQASSSEAITSELLFRASHDSLVRSRNGPYAQLLTLVAHLRKENQTLQSKIALERELRHEIRKEFLDIIPQAVGPPSSIDNLHAGCRPLLGVGLETYTPTPPSQEVLSQLTFVHQDQWTNPKPGTRPSNPRGNHSKDENRAQHYIETQLGPVSGKRADHTRTYGKSTLECLWHSGQAAESFALCSTQAKGFVYYNLGRAIPEITWCDDGTWKINILMQELYSPWAQKKGITRAQLKEKEKAAKASTSSALPPPPRDDRLLSMPPKQDDDFVAPVGFGTNPLQAPEAAMSSQSLVPSHQPAVSAPSAGSAGIPTSAQPAPSFPLGDRAPAPATATATSTTTTTVTAESTHGPGAAAAVRPPSASVSQIESLGTPEALIHHAMVQPGLNEASAGATTPQGNQPGSGEEHSHPSSPAPGGTQLPEEGSPAHLEDSSATLTFTPAATTPSAATPAPSANAGGPPPLPVTPLPNRPPPGPVETVKKKQKRVVLLRDVFKENTISWQNELYRELRYGKETENISYDDAVEQKKAIERDGGERLQYYKDKASEMRKNRSIPTQQDG